MSEINNELELNQLPKNRYITGSDINSYRDDLIDKYRDSHRSVLKNIKQKSDITSDEILSIIIEEILQGGENMLGTQLLFEQQGNLQMSTATILKRSELLKSVADIVAKKKQLNQRAADIDLNSPAFMLFQKMVFDKFMETFEELNIDPEMVNLIVSGFQKRIKNWGKELKAKLEELTQ